MIVLVQRDPVKPDDSNLARLLDLPDRATVEDVIRHLAKSRFLPRLPGGRATWIAEAERPLAVVAQEYRDPWPLVPLAVPFAEVAGRLPRPHLKLVSRARQSAEDVYRELGGDPVRLPKSAWDATGDIDWTLALREFLTPPGR